MTKKQEDLGYLTSGVAMLVAGLLLIIFNEYVIINLTYWIGGLVGILGLLEAAKSFLPSKRLQGLKARFSHLVASGIQIALGAWVMTLGSGIAFWLSRGIGFYQLLMAAVNLFNYYLLRKDKIGGRFNYLVVGLLNLIWGISSFVGSNEVGPTLVRLGFYLIFIGFTWLADSRDMVLNDSRKQNIRRRSRVGVPVVFTMLMPAGVLKKINNFLNEEFELPEETVYEEKRIANANPVLKVFIHVSEKGTGLMGHVDLSYKGKVYAYGSYDVDSERVFGSVGDGSFFSLDEADYIDYCLENGKTLFEYTVALTAEQQKAFEDKLAELFDMMIPWTLTSERQKESYVGVMVNRYQAKTHKFVKSRFKTYFVLGTNCVLLADQLIGSSGLDLITMVGILAPGTYYDYFQQEFKKPNSIVVGERIHHAGLRQRFNY